LRETGKPHPLDTGKDLEAAPAPARDAAQCDSFRSVACLREAGVRFRIRRWHCPVLHQVDMLILRDVNGDVGAVQTKPAKPLRNDHMARGEAVLDLRLRKIESYALEAEEVGIGGEHVPGDATRRPGGGTKPEIPEFLRGSVGRPWDRPEVLQRERCHGCVALLSRLELMCLTIPSSVESSRLTNAGNAVSCHGT